MFHRSERANPTLPLLLVAATSIAVAAPKPRVPASPKKAPPRVVLGTKQLSGDQAVPGQEYTLGKASPINFQLNTVEYSTARLLVGDSDYLPAANEKFLVIHYTLHNPQKAERLVRFDTLRYTAVDSTNTNQEGRQRTGVESTREALNIKLKPGQKIDGYTYITISATATVPKLIVTSSDNLVLRYDLNGKIKPLTGPSASSEDSTGATALGEVTAQLGTAYEMGAFDVTVVSASYAATPIGNQRLKAGDRNLVLSLKMRNGTRRKQTLRFDTLRLKAVDADGAPINWRSNLLTNSRDAEFSAPVEPGQEVSVRTYLVVVKDQRAKAVTLSMGNANRQYVYDISSVQ